MRGTAEQWLVVWDGTRGLVAGNGRGGRARGCVGNGRDQNVWWRQGEKQKVVDYCIDDVKLTKELYDHVLQSGKVKYPDGKMIRELALNTSDWEKKKENVLTHTLPF